MKQAVVRRPNLPLTARDEQDLNRLRTAPEFRRALSEISTTPIAEDEELGESALLHAVFAAGLEAIRRRAEDVGYEQLAAGFHGDSAERRQTSRRRKPAWADES